jgi:hypothetical protein
MMPAMRPPSDPRASEDLTGHLLTDAAAGAAQFIGAVFVIVGATVAFVIVGTGGARARSGQLAIAAVATVLIAPGLFYALAGAFLRRRHYWAWRATWVMTWILLWIASLFCAGFAASMTTTSGPLYAVGPLITFACWGAALYSIVQALRRCLPVIQDADRTKQKGFTIVPRAAATPTPEAPR